MGFSINGNVITITKKVITQPCFYPCNFAISNDVNHIKNIKNNFQTIMQNLLYSIVILLLIFWGLGFFIYNTGAIIHLLLLAAVAIVLLKIIKGEKV